MEVGRWMTTTPVLVGSSENLAAVRLKMEQGNFHRVPVVDNGKLVGIVCDSDLRQHAGALEKVKVNGAMTRPVATVTPTTMLERAANLLVQAQNRRIAGCRAGQGGWHHHRNGPAARLHRGPWRYPEGVSRIDLSLGDSSELPMIVQLVAQESCEILGVGTYEGEEGGRRVTYLRLRSADSSRVARMLTEKNYQVLSIHS